MPDLPYTIDDLQTAVRLGNVKWSIHALQRMRERNIKMLDYKHCILSGEIIEEYPKDHIMPSCLVSGKSVTKLPLHSVAGYSKSCLYAVTAYYPDTEKWENDFKTRKGR